MSESLGVGSSDPAAAVVSSGPADAACSGKSDETQSNLGNLGGRHHRRCGAGGLADVHHSERSVGEGVLLHHECEDAARRRSADCSGRRSAACWDRGVTAYLAAASPLAPIEMSLPTLVLGNRRIDLRPCSIAIRSSCLTPLPPMCRLGLTRARRFSVLSTSMLAGGAASMSTAVGDGHFLFECRPGIPVKGDAEQNPDQQ